MWYVYWLLNVLIVLISLGFMTERKNSVQHKWFHFFYSCCVGCVLLLFSMGSVTSIIRFLVIEPPLFLVYFLMYVLPLLTFILFQVKLYQKEE